MHQWFPPSMRLVVSVFALASSQGHNSSSFPAFSDLPGRFLAAIAALYLAMSVSRSVGWSVNNEFQGVQNAIKVYIMILFRCIVYY